MIFNRLEVGNLKCTRQQGGLLPEAPGKDADPGLSGFWRRRTPELTASSLHGPDLRSGDICTSLLTPPPPSSPRAPVITRGGPPKSAGVTAPCQGSRSICSLLPREVAWASVGAEIQCSALLSREYVWSPRQRPTCGVGVPWKHKSVTPGLSSPILQMGLAKSMPQGYHGALKTGPLGPTTRGCVCGQCQCPWGTDVRTAEGVC